MSGAISVRHLGGDRFAIDIRDHTITVDQPTDAGGEDSAPTPTELFIAALASCVAFYARRYLLRHDIAHDGFGVTTEHTMASGPARIGGITLLITPPYALPTDRRDAFLSVASHCTVHNTLQQPPQVQISLTAQQQP